MKKQHTDLLISQRTAKGEPPLLFEFGDYESMLVCLQSVSQSFFSIVVVRL